MGFFSWLFSRKKDKNRVDDFDADQYMRMTAAAQKAGQVDGRHYTDYLDEIRTLKKTDPDHAISLLLRIVDAVEAQALIDGMEIPPAYYDHLAILYRKRKEYAKEVGILERYVTLEKERSMGAIVARLEKAKQLARG